MDKNTRTHYIYVHGIKPLQNILEINGIEDPDETRHMNDGPEYDYIYNSEGGYSDCLIKDICRNLRNAKILKKQKVVNIGTGRVTSRYFANEDKIKNGDIIILNQLSGYRNEGKLICHIDQYNQFKLMNLDFSIDEYGSLPKTFYVSDVYHSSYWRNHIEHNTYIWINPDWVKPLKENITFGSIENYGLDGVFTYSKIRMNDVQYVVIYVSDDELSNENKMKEFKQSLKKYKNNENSVSFHRFEELNDNVGDPNGYIVHLPAYYNEDNRDEVIIMKYHNYDNSE